MRRKLAGKSSKELTSRLRCTRVADKMFLSPSQHKGNAIVFLVCVAMIASASAVYYPSTGDRSHALSKGMLTIHNKAFLSGGTLATTVVSSFTECLDLCAADPQCLSLDFYAKSGVFRCRTQNIDSTTNSAYKSHKSHTSVQYIGNPISDYMRLSHQSFASQTALQTHSGVSAADCSANCAAHADCDAFDLVEGTCSLFQGVSDADASNTTRATAYVAQSSLSTCDGQFLLQTQTKLTYTSGDVVASEYGKSGTAASLSACRGACKDNVDCASFNFRRARKNLCVQLSINHQSAATVANSRTTYEYKCISGCTDPTMTEYNSLATVDDGSCASPMPSGCTDSSADNYDPAAMVDDSSCVRGGCPNVTACNYNSMATYDDGSCIFCCDGYKYHKGFRTYGGHKFKNVAGISDTQENCWNHCTATASCQWVFHQNHRLARKRICALFSSKPTLYASTSHVVLEKCVGGCTDPLAANFDSLATDDDGSCDMDLSGGSDSSGSGGTMVMGHTQYEAHVAENTTSAIVDAVLHSGSVGNFFPYTLLENGEVYFKGAKIPFSEPIIRMWSGESQYGTVIFGEDSSRAVHVMYPDAVWNAHVCIQTLAGVEYHQDFVNDYAISLFPASVAGPVQKISMNWENTLILYEDGSVRICGNPNGGRAATSPTDILAPAGFAVDIDMGKFSSHILASNGDLFVAGRLAGSKCVRESTTVVDITPTIYATDVAKLVPSTDRGIGYIDNSGNFHFCDGTAPWNQIVATNVESAIEDVYYLTNSGDMFMKSPSINTFAVTPAGFKAMNDVYTKVAEGASNLAGPIGYSFNISLAEPNTVAVQAGETYLLSTNRQGVHLHGSTLLTTDALQPYTASDLGIGIGTPVQVASTSLGTDRAIVLDANGKAFMVGHNVLRLAGAPNDPNESGRYTPYELANMPTGPVKKVAMGNGAAYVLMEDGSLYGWGFDTTNQLCGRNGGTGTAEALLLHSDVRDMWVGHGLYYSTNSDEMLYFCGKNTARMGLVGSTTVSAKFADEPVMMKAGSSSSVFNAASEIRDIQTTQTYIFVLYNNGTVRAGGGTSLNAWCGVRTHREFLSAELGLENIVSISTAETAVLFLDANGDATLCGFTRHQDGGDILDNGAVDTDPFVVATGAVDAAITGDDNVIMLDSNNSVKTLCSTHIGCGQGTLAPASTFTEIATGVQSLSKSTWMTLFHSA